MNCSSSRTWYGFMVIFIIVFGGLYALYLCLPEDFLASKLYFYGITAPCAALIHVVAPLERVQAFGDQLVGRAAALSIVRGCDGAGMYFLLIAAIVAARNRLKRSVFGILGATILIYVVNQLRIFSLYFVLARHSEWFAPLHAYAFPAFFIGIGLVYFTLWLNPLPSVSIDNVPPAVT